MKKIVKILSIVMILAIAVSSINFMNVNAAEGETKIDIANLKIEKDGTSSDMKKYTKNDFDSFLSDYQNGTLPEVYVTEFLFDGVSMVKTYDLDDYIEKGNDVEVKNLSLTVINVNTTGNIEFTGEIKGGMIAVNTNGKKGNINLILNGVNIDTDSKKAPAIYVYNKDITYTDCVVTIKTISGTKNYIEGGKFKKVSLVGKEDLGTYANKYSGDNKTNYETYTNYYGVYSNEQIDNILFAKVQADSEDLAEGDPLYFYKGAGAISSDIDLNFEGAGYLEVKSKNKEGIETKGNLSLLGGTGDYVVYAYDDCLNTTTKTSSGTNVRNTLVINVNSLYAIVDPGEDADEGDAIDSNGELIISGGTIIAIAHPGQDAGLDSESGTTINGGTIIATGDMYDQISSDSKQNYAVFSFQSSQKEDDLIVLLNSKDEVVMAYKTDRTYSNLVYSSSILNNGEYKLYKGGEIEGTNVNGFYTSVTSYEKGTEQGYSGNNIGMFGGMQTLPNMNGNSKNNVPEGFQFDSQFAPSMRDTANVDMKNMGSFTADNNMEMSNIFKIEGISNLFSNVGTYTGSNNSSSNIIGRLIANPIYSIIITCVAVIFMIIIIVLLVKIKKLQKNK